MDSIPGAPVTRCGLGCSLLFVAWLLAAAGPVAAQDGDHHGDPGLQVDPVGGAAGGAGASPSSGPTNAGVDAPVKKTGGSIDLGSGGGASMGAVTILAMLLAFLKAIKAAVSKGPT